MQDEEEDDVPDVPGCHSRCRAMAASSACGCAPWHLSRTGGGEDVPICTTGPQVSESSLV